MWQQWANGILGIWVLLTPYLGFSSSALKTVLLITGIIIAILGFWGAMNNRGAYRE